MTEVVFAGHVPQTFNVCHCNVVHPGTPHVPDGEPERVQVEILRGDQAYFETGRNEPCAAIRLGLRAILYLNAEDLRKILVRCVEVLP